MNKLITAILILMMSLYVFRRCTAQHKLRLNGPQPSAVAPVNAQAPMNADAPVNAEEAIPRFACAGKTRYHQMTSCEEATFYLHNCPGVQIDGDGDGVPCEKEYCGH
jgi:hypothetical protein